jgi:predicted dehydrogenase
MPQPASAKLRFAVVGCGRMGRHHGRHLLQDGRGDIVAVFDPARNMAERLCADLRIQPRIVPSFDDLLAASEIDAVILCAPTGLHYHQAKASLAKGWHVLCEKPLANSRPEILELIDLGRAAARQGLVFSIGYQRRYWTGYRTLKRELASRKWGPVRAVAMHIMEDWQRTISGTWRDDPEQNPGGFIGDAGSHKIDMIFHLTALAPREVFARTWKCGSRVEIVASVSAVLEDDVPCTLNFLGHARHLGEDVSLHCAEADLLLRQERLWIARQGCLEPLPMDEPDSNPVSALLDAIQGKAPNLCPADCALPVYDFTQAIFRSAATGANVDCGS